MTFNDRGQPERTTRAIPDGGREPAILERYHIPAFHILDVRVARLYKTSPRQPSGSGDAMWLVRVALQRPYTFIVMSLLIVIIGVLSIVKMPTDIFPSVDIPVISVVWNYGGLPPEEMERRVTSNFERFLTTTVNDIEHVESQTLTGIAIIKIFFQPEAKIEEATAQVTSIAQTAVRQMPPGATPPLIIRYSASNVPILQLALGSDTLSEQQLFDLGVNFVRADIATVPGAQIHVAVRRQAAPGDGRHRPETSLRLGTLAQRREQRARARKRGAAFGHGQRWVPRSTRSSSTAARADGRDRRDPDQVGAWNARLHSGCRPRA